MMVAPTLRLAAAAAAAAAAATAAVASAQRAAFTSAPVMVYDWVTQHCPHYPPLPRKGCVPDILENCDPDVPDACPRLWANSPTDVHQFSSVDGVSRAQLGRSLDALTHACDVPPYANATYDANLTNFRNHEWIEAPVAFPGNGTVYALTHVDSLNGTTQTSHPNNYLYTSITLFASTDGGRTFAPARPPPGHLVATSPYDNRNGSLGAGIGFGMPSSVLRAKDGYFYVLLLTGWGVDIEQQRGGLCLARTPDITDPAAWRAWNGSDAGFAATLNASPLLGPVTNVSAHICAPVTDTTGAPLALRHTALLWSSLYGRYLLFGERGGGGALNGTGWAFALSDDLVIWDPPVAVDTAGFIDPAGNATIGPQLSPMPGRFIRTADPADGSWWVAPDGSYKAPVTACEPCPGLGACGANATLVPTAAWAALPNATMPFSCSLVYAPRGYINYVYSVLADPTNNTATGGGDPNFNVVGETATVFFVAKKCAGVTYSPSHGGLACTPLDATQRDQRDIVRATIRFS